MPIAQGFQFGRFAEVEIKNFITKEKTVISNDFEIDFEFFKTVDQIDGASTGVVRIYGLTQDTFDRVRSDGGEISLRCGYSNSDIITLFVADILMMDMFSSNGTTTTTITCSANVLTHMFGGYVNAGFTDSSLMEILGEVGRKLGKRVVVGSNNVPKDNIKEYFEYLHTRSFNVDFFGSPQDFLTAISYSFDFEVVVDAIDRRSGNDEEVILMVQRSGGVAESFRHIQNGYSKIDRTSTKFKTLKDQENKLAAIFVTPDDEFKTALVLTKDTGLKKVNMGFKLATATETQELAANEEQTESSKEKQSERDQKERERLAKYKEKVKEGKKVKPYEKKVSTIKVNRKYLTVEALLNPSLRPQSHVLISTSNTSYNGIYVTRDIKYKGNNRQGDWTMTITCEDTLGRYDTIAKDQTQQTEEEQETTLTGSVGDNTSYGATDE